MHRRRLCILKKVSEEGRSLSNGVWAVQVVKYLQNLYERLVYDFPRDNNVLESIKARTSFHKNNEETELFMEAVELPAVDDEPFFKTLQRLRTTLSTKDSLLDVPKGLGETKYLAFQQLLVHDHATSTAGFNLKY